MYCCNLIPGINFCSLTLSCRFAKFNNEIFVDCELCRRGIIWEWPPHINIHVCKVEHESKLTINGELRVWVYMNWGYHMSFPHDKGVSMAPFLWVSGYSWWLKLAMVMVMGMSLYVNQRVNFQEITHKNCKNYYSSMVMVHVCNTLYILWCTFHVSIVLCLFPVKVRCSRRECISHVPMQAV